MSDYLPTQAEIDLLFRYGYYTDLLPEGEKPTTHTPANIHFMAIDRYHGFFEQEMNDRVANHHGRSLHRDGLWGDASTEMLAQPRCGFPDILPATAQPANWPEACRMNITTSYKMDLSGLGDSELAALWEEADQNWADELEVGFDFRPQDYPNTRIYAFEAALGGSVLADQFLATNDCGYRSRGRFDNRTWTDVLFVTTATHEHGHALGSPHVSDPSATMYPSITNASMSRRGRPNGTDVSRMLALGYERRTTPDPDPPPDPPSGLLRIEGAPQEAYIGDTFVGQVEIRPKAADPPS